MHGFNEDIHTSKKHVKSGFTYYIHLKAPHIYSESKTPDVLKYPFKLNRCEHYSKIGTRDHYIQFLDDLYDLEYLEAYFDEDTEMIDQIETAAAEVGYGPLSKCTTVTNFSAQHVCCYESHSAHNSLRFL